MPRWKKKRTRHASSLVAGARPQEPFDLLYAELQDLDLADPMRPAALVRAFGASAQSSYEAIQHGYPTYVIGRGLVPDEVGKGYFFMACKPDYAVLRKALRPYWPAMSPFPEPQDEVAILFSQEYSDVLNYIAHPPQPDPTILGEVHQRLHGLVPDQHLEPAARVCEWLVENMLPANNCYTLSMLLMRWLVDRDVPTRYCEGRVTHKGKFVDHAWVEIEGKICDLTVNRQKAWKLEHVYRIRVEDERLAYSPQGGLGWEQRWYCFSRPPDRPSYTRASRCRQAQMIKGTLPEELWDVRLPWIALVRDLGILEGTRRLLDQVGQ